MAHATKTALVWPAGLARTANPIAGRGRTRVGVSVAAVLAALDLLGEVTSLPASEIVLTFEQNTGRGQIIDGGAAVWFLWDDVQHCVGCDLYANPGDNLFAIAHIVRGCVAEHDRGSVAAVRHALESHKQRPNPLPAPPDRQALHASDDWSTLLEVSDSTSHSALTSAFRRLAHEKHPDKGGDRGDWDRLMIAYERARSFLVARQAAPDRWEVIDSREDNALWSILFPEDKMEC